MPNPQKNIKLLTLNKHIKDLTNLNTYSIDDKVAYEIDDAISLEVNSPNSTIWIHISDPASLIELKSEIKQLEANIKEIEFDAECQS